MRSELREKNLRSEIISAPYAGSDIARLLQEKTDQVARVAREIHALNPDRIIFIGSGASWCTLYTGQYFLDMYSAIPSELYTGPDLSAKDPAYLSDRMVAILASYSGKTADTLTGLGVCKKHRLMTVAISREGDGPLARATDMALTYESGALYTSPMALQLMLFAQLLKLRKESPQGAKAVAGDLAKLPSIMDSILERTQEEGLRYAREAADDGVVYFMAGGALFALGYQYAYTIFHEYLRRYAIHLSSAEFRHGPLEVFTNNRPRMIHLIGSGEHRRYDLNTAAFCQKHNPGKNIVLDAESYAKLHPVLGPFVLFPTLQYMLLESAELKQIDLDEYSYMHVVPYIEGETYF